MTRGLIVVGALVLLLAACSPPRNNDPTATPAPSPSATATATATATPTATPSPTATPTATPFVPPTVAIVDGDSVSECIKRNLGPGLLYTLSQDDDSLTNDILRSCLNEHLPDVLVSMMGPIIDRASACAVDVSQTLSNQDLITLNGPDGEAKDELVSDVTNDILRCTAEKLHIPVGWFD